MTAVIGKEWRRILRSPGTPWALLTYLVFPLLGAALQLKLAAGTRVMPGFSPQILPQMGAQALSTLAAWQLILLAVGAPWMSAPLLTGEVEERTLDPLLAGGTSLFSVVAGKWLAVASFVWLQVVAGLPMFILPAVAGGVTWTLLGRVLALELAVAAMMAGLGLLFSSWGRRVGSVAVTGVAAGLVLTVGAALAAGVDSAASVYSPEQAIIMMKMRGMPQPGRPAGAGEVPAYLYPNPLVGLNSALGQTGPQFNLPGADSAPVYKQYRLWQVQLAGAGAVAVTGILAAWVTIAVRRRFVWRWRWSRKRVKEVAANG